MKATTSTALLPLLLGLGLSLPATAAQEGPDTDGGRYVAAEEAMPRSEQRFRAFAGGEEEMTREPFPGVTTGARDAGVASRQQQQQQQQQAQRTTEPATEAQGGERPRPLQSAQAGAGAGRGTGIDVRTGATGARTNAVELAVTEETLQARYFTDSGRLGVQGGSLAAGLLLSDDRDIVLSGTFLAPNVLATAVPGPLALAVGARAYAGFLADPNDDVFAIAPGLEARYTLPFGLPVAVVGNIFYAPEILAFGDADSVLDFNVRGEVQVSSSVVAFAGYRLLDFDRDNAGDDEVVENVQIGVRFAF